MNKGIARYVKIYFMIISQDIKSKMQYRADFIISSIGMLFVNVSAIVSFWIIFNLIPTLQDWTFNEVLFMYGFSVVALTPAQMFFDNIWNLEMHVATGDFIKYCFRPLNIFFYYVSEVFDMKGLSQLLIGIATISYSFYNLHIKLTPGIFILMIAAILSASLIMVGILVLASASAFWLLNSKSIVIFMHRCKDYAKYPVTIFNPILKFIFTFIIPIAFISFYPSTLFLRQGNVPVLAYFSPVVGVAFFLIAYFVWMKGAGKYSGTGS